MIVKIENFTHEGRGITKVNDKVTFVENALPGEVVDIKITKEKKNYNEALCTKVIESSPNRMTPSCPYYNECAGCDLMHMNYKQQLEFKKEKVKNIIKKYADIEVNPKIIESYKELGYRNKITIHESNNKVGYKKGKSNEILEIDSCPLGTFEINKYYIENKHNFKDELIIRSNELGEIISSTENSKMIITINDFKFQIDINSFFQVNNYICGKIFETLNKNLDNINTCLDLYSGVGTLSIVASTKAKKVYSIEVNEYSYENAKTNAKLNNITNINFMLGKVEEQIEKINEKVDVIITDPPRAGMDTKTINIIQKLNPKKLIYISCDPMTLARDLKLLNATYSLEDITLFDMFPNTKHVETMCVLKNKK